MDPNNVVHIGADKETLIEDLVLLVIKAIQSLAQTRPFISIVLTGGSLIGTLSKALLAHKSELSPFVDKLRFILGDERFVGPESTDSTMGAYINENLFTGLNIRPDQIFPIKYDAATAQECAQDYDQRLRALLNENNGFDIAILGMGPDGHCLSLFPGHPLFTSSSAEKRLVAEILDSPKPPPQRVTITLNFLNNSSYLLFFSCGESKADILKKILKDKDLSLPSANVQPKTKDGVLKWFIDAPSAKFL